MTVRAFAWGCLAIVMAAGAGCQRQGQSQLLFDGTDTAAWRGIHSETFPEQGWVVQDGLLVCDPVKGVPQSDIVTRQQYGDFDLELEFKLTEGANSGVKYLVVESLNTGRSGLGLEYQILDDARHPDAKMGKNGNRTLASLYDLIPAAADKPTRPIGQWNTARIVSKGRRVEHWLNGVKVVDYTRDDPAFRKLVAESKFKDITNFGLAEKGCILLQSHNDKVFFRNIRIRVPN